MIQNTGLSSDQKLSLKKLSRSLFGFLPLTTGSFGRADC